MSVQSSRYHLVEVVPETYCAGVHSINRLDGNSLLDWVVFGSVTRGTCARYVLGHEGHVAQGKSVVRTHEGHTVELTGIPATLKAVVNKRQDDKLVYGVAEIPTPTVSDEKDLIIKVEAAPINPSDLGSVGMLARFGADSIAVGEAAFTVTVPFPQALEGMFKADGDTKPVGRIRWPPCAHHVAPSTEYPVCPNSEYSTAVTLCIMHWSLFVVELGERNDPWSELRSVVRFRRDDVWHSRRKRPESLLQFEGD